MMNYADIGLANTFLPLAGLAALALLLPLVTVPRGTRSHARLAAGMALAAALTFGAALGLFAALHAGAGNAPRMGTVARAAALSALAWAPLLGLAWLGRAQGVEARRGEDMARINPGDLT